MITCVCGHQQASGRFCSRCGADLVAPTAVRGEEPPPAPLPPSSPPPTTPEGQTNARFPMYADEATTAVRPQAAIPAPLWEQPASQPSPEPPRRSRVVLIGLVTILLLAAVAGVGTWLLTRDTGSDEADSPPPSSDVPTETQDPQPQTPTASSPTAVDSPGAAGELAADATVIPPDTAPDGADVAGNPVSFAAGQMIDGDPTTCWRMPGDGTGQLLAITLPTEVTLTEVGLINGYAKTDRHDGDVVDWYQRNRRITAVTWTFDDGTSVSQDLTDSRELQTVPVDVTTSTIEVTIDSVTRPARGPDGRDYTAISEITLLGS